ncbi:hypothetical protein E2562_019487 [Oryza meyeriana var. granulata]|uniref:Uncharacterized protein n=1 Tax=Oryza meyeriana var. granulata TaxID=110450 RepID=A0A6G1DKC0_9ORYZ|nr:hypothetical protein E2562_019487 [Oryza meyeriana var. granulata]
MGRREAHGGARDGGRRTDGESVVLHGLPLSASPLLFPFHPWTHGDWKAMLRAAHGSGGRRKAAEGI